MRKQKKHIAPRLAGGEIRLQLGSRLAPAIKDGLRAIAASEGRSMSWVIEETLIEFFGLRRPRYLRAIHPKPQGRTIQIVRRRTA